MVSLVLISCAGLMGCSEAQDITFDQPTHEPPATVESLPDNVLSFAQITGIDLDILPEQVTEGEDYIERIEARVPRETMRYEYSGTNETSEFCQAFYAAFDQDKRDFIRIVQTSGDFAKFSFDGRFRPYIEPTDVKDILSGLGFPSIPWKDVPKGVEAATQAYNMHHAPSGIPARRTLQEFLNSLPADYEPYQLYQIYRAENSGYTLYRTEGTHLFSPDLKEEVKFATKSPDQFPTYRHHFYSTKVMHAGRRAYLHDTHPLLKDFVTADGLHFVTVSGGMWWSGLLGDITVTRLDTKQRPSITTAPPIECSIKIYLNPKHKLHR